MIGRALRRLARAAGITRDVRRCEQELARSRQRLQKSEAARAALELRLNETREHLGAARDAAAQARRATARWKQQVERHRRRVASPAILRDLLPARAAQLACRAAARQAAAREEQFAAVSEAYRMALQGSGAPSPPDARRIRLDGLVWWVPIGPGEGERVARVLRKEALPYRALTQTREFSGGGIMLDLGAHDGGTAIPRVVLGDVEACYCAEPDPLNYACLAANVVENGLRGFVLPDRVAIGRKARPASLARTKATRGHRVLPADAAATGELVAVPMTTLDGWVQRLGLDPGAISFIKSDTQGCELQVLEGAARLLAHRQIAWQLEVCPGLMTAAGDDPRDFVALLQRHFTHFVALDPDAPGKRRRRIERAGEVLEFLARASRTHTDVVVYSASEVP